MSQVLENNPIPPITENETKPSIPLPPKFELNFDNYLNLWYKFHMLEFFVALLINKKEWPKDKIEELVNQAQTSALNQCKVMFPQYAINLQTSTPTDSNTSSTQETQVAPS